MRISYMQISVQIEHVRFGGCDVGIEARLHDADAQSLAAVAVQRLVGRALVCTLHVVQSFAR